MDLSAVIKAVLAPLEAQRPGELLQNLRPGDKLTGLIVKIESDGRVLMDLGRSRVLAQVAFEVRTGQVLDLQVVESGPVLHLRAAGPQGAPPTAGLAMTDFSSILTDGQREQLIQAADRMIALPDIRLQGEPILETVRHAIMQIRALFDPAPLEKPVDQLARWIKGALEDRGVLFEKRLSDWVVKAERMPAAEKPIEDPHSLGTVLIARDIKAQLIILKNFLAEGNESQLAALKLEPKTLNLLQQSVGRLLGHVEQQQERAVARWEKGETQQVMVSLMPFADQPRTFQLKVYYPGKHHGEEEHAPQHIALLLDLDRLGAVRVDLALIAEQLHVRFFVSSEAVKTRFQQEVHRIEESLSARFDKLQVEIFVSPDKIVQFHDEDLKGAAPGRIDISA